MRVIARTRSMTFLTALAVSILTLVAYRHEDYARLERTVTADAVAASRRVTSALCPASRSRAATAAICAALLPWPKITSGRPTRSSRCNWPRKCARSARANSAC